MNQLPRLRSTALQQSSGVRAALASPLLERLRRAALPWPQPEETTPQVILLAYDYDGFVNVIRDARISTHSDVRSLLPSVASPEPLASAPMTFREKNKCSRGGPAGIHVQWSSGNGTACFRVQHDARPTAGGSGAAQTQEHARGRSSERRRRSTRPAWRKPREAVETGQLRRRWGAGTSSVVSRG